MTGQPVAPPPNEAQFRLNPDPSTRTLESIEQRVHDFQRLADIRFKSEDEARNAIREIIEVRIAGIEKAQLAFQNSITGVPTEVDKQVSQLKELHEKQFNARFDGLSGSIQAILRQIDEGNQGVQRQLEGMQRQSEQTSVAAKDAVNTAFLASKEAVAAAFSAARELGIAQNTFVAAANEKTEKNVNLLLDRLTDLVKTSNGGLEQQINNLKERFSGIERRLSIMDGRGSGMATSWGVVVAVIGAFLGISGFIFALLRQ